MSHRARELPVGMRIWGYFLSSPQGTWEKMRGVLGKLEIDTRAVPSQTQKSKPFFRNLPRGHGGVGPEEGAGADPDLQGPERAQGVCIAKRWLSRQPIRQASTSAG